MHENNKQIKDNGCAWVRRGDTFTNISAYMGLKSCVYLCICVCIAPIS